MNYIVLDLEWNQAPVPSLENPKIPFEIIEIGAVRLNQALEPTGEFSRLIKPKIYRKMHTHTKRIINLSMSDLMAGDDFVDACREFLQFAGESPLFCTWGPQDITELQRNMIFYNMRPLSGGPVPFLDVQKLYAIAFNEGSTRRSLESAIEQMAIPKDISFHRALGDASYTARILNSLPDFVLEYHSYDMFLKPSDKAHEIHHCYPDYYKYISREFNTKVRVLEDKEVKSTGCYICKTALPPQEEWFTPNGKHYYNISHCKKHGLIKSKIRLHKTPLNGGYYVVKTQKLISDDDLKELMAIKDRAKYFRELPRKVRKNVKIPR